MSTTNKTYNLNLDLHQKNAKRNQYVCEFDWLVDPDDSLMVLDWDSPAKTSDFGLDGYTGSVSDWHELLQLTAPDNQCGVVFARGKFPDDPEAILARAQNFNRKDAWGLKLLIDTEIKTRKDFDQGANYRLGNAQAQGFINYRWPYMKFALEREGNYDGTCEICSYIKDGQLYQIHRFVPGEPLGLKKKISVQSGMGSKQKDAIVSDIPQRAANNTVAVARAAAPIKFRIGGEVRFGCSCTNGDETWHGDNYNIDHIDAGNGLSCSSDRYQTSLDMRLIVNGSKCQIGNTTRPEPRSFLDITNTVGSHILEDRPEWTTQSAQLGVFHEVSLEYDNPTIIIVNFALRPWKSLPKEPDCLSGQDTREYLGASKRMWDSCKRKDDGSINFPDITAIARTVEIILSVLSVPVQQLLPMEEESTFDDQKGKDQELAPEFPSSSSIPNIRKAPMLTNEDAPNIPSIEVVSPQVSKPPEVQKEPVKEHLRHLLQKNERGIAILSNIIAAQHAETQTTFWALRLLVKAHAFLATQSFSTLGSFKGPPSSSMVHLHNVYVRYSQRVLAHIRGILIWLLASPLTSGVNSVPCSIGTNTSRREDCPRHLQPGGLQLWYAMMSICYILKYCYEAAEPVLCDDRIQARLEFLISVCRVRDPRENREQDLEMSLLRWHHYGSLVEICEKLENDIRPDSLNRWYLEDLIQRREAWQKIVQRIINPTRRPRSHSYSARHEIIDRLALLSWEMHPHSYAFTAIKACVGYVTQRLRQREPTKIINPGIVDHEASDPDIPHDAPWEIICLNHHTPLLLLSSSEEVERETKIAESMEACAEFSFSDYTFASTWDESNANMIGSWWNLETSCVLSSTLLNLQTTATLVRVEDAQNSTPSSFIPEIPFLTPIIASKDQPLTEDTLRKVIERQLRQQQEIMDFSRRNQTQYRWKEFRPSFEFHPSAWLQSLDDTPGELFIKPQTKNVQLRKRVIAYLSVKNGQKAPGPPKWDISSVYKHLSAGDLQFISVFDFPCKAVFEVRVRGRSDPDFIGTFVKADRVESSMGDESDDSDEDEDYEGDPVFEKRLWPWLLQEQAGNISRPPLPYHIGQKTIDTLKEPDIRQNFSLKYQSYILAALNDSMVDRDVKYRLLYAKHCCPSLVTAFMYMWHPEALDAFDDYFGSISHFTNIVDDNWTTQITLTHWGLQKTGILQLPSQFIEARKEGQFPPMDVQNLVLEVKRSEENLPSDHDPVSKALVEKQLVGECSSTLVITGDSKGRFWVCSIWSALVEEEQMSHYAQKVTRILQLFIHKPSTGRCLIFMLLLGFICEKLADEYKRIVDSMDSIIFEQDVFLNANLTWDSKNAVNRLKTMLWGLEALRVFEEKLGSSLAEIKKAYDTLNEIIAQEPGKLHGILFTESKNIMEEFKKQWELLGDFREVIQLKISQVTGLRESISTITNLIDSNLAAEANYQASVDSKTAIKQGENIRVLTMITIAYLPLGFVYALFSMNHNIVPDSFGSGHFGWLIAISVTCTFGLAFSLETIITGLKRVRQNFSRSSPKKVRLAEFKDNFKRLREKQIWPESALIGRKKAMKELLDGESRETAVDAKESMTGANVFLNGMNGTAKKVRFLDV